MDRTRTSTPAGIAITLCAALIGAACGASDPSSEADVTVSSTGVDPTISVATTDETPSTTTTTTTTPATTAATTTTTTTPATTTPATTTIAAPTTTTAPVATTLPALSFEFCEGATPLPTRAVLEYQLGLDMMDDGTADDLIEAYDIDGVSRLRLTTGGSVVSEIINPQIDGRYRPLGVASVLPGDSAELFAVIGEGSAAAEIGLFGIDSADCLFSYTYTGTSDDFTMLIRPLSPVRAGAFCFEGGIALYGAEQRSDGKWDAYSSAFEIATPWTLRYMGASDDYSEGLDESELRTFDFDCLGLSL